jgi:hypothetical protein
VQLRTAIAAALGAAALAGALPARADDRAEVTTTWFLEQRRGGQGALSVINPRVDLAVDVGEHAEISLGYAADVVSGATAAIYAVDAVSSATKFSDTRHEGSLGLSFEGSRSRLALSVGGGRERDYRSLSVGGSASIDLPGKNTTFGLSYNHGFDQVCDRDNAMATPLERRPLTGVDPCEQGVLLGEDTPGMTIWHDLSIDTAQGTITQNVSPTLLLQVGLYGQVLRGFQANPYRRVRVAGVEAQEHLPDVRGRLALFVDANKFLPSIRGAIHGQVRGYSDTWGVGSLTAELAYAQYLGKALLLRVRGRVYQQREATFFKDAYFYDTQGPAGEYFTGDRELAPVRNVLVGGRISYIKQDPEGGKVAGVFEEVQLNLKADLLYLTELPANPESENRVGRTDQFLSAGSLIDAFVLQLGIVTRF